MAPTLNINSGLVALYVGQDPERIEIVSHGLLDTVEQVMIERNIPAARATIGERPDIGILVVDPTNADQDFLDTYSRLLQDMRVFRPDMIKFLIDGSEYSHGYISYKHDQFYGSRMAEIITSAGQEWARRRSERQLREHSVEILYTIARKSDPRESLRKLVELLLPYLDIPFADQALLVQTARLYPILNLFNNPFRTPPEDNIFQNILVLTYPPSGIGLILDILCYFELVLQRQTADPLHCALNGTSNEFDADNPLVKALQQLIRDKPAEVSAIYTR